MIIILCYFLSCFVNPTQPIVEDYISMNYKNITNIEIDKYNDCEFCHLKKFERSSHCRQCNKCILRRDHHCVWIGNCVGYANNQYFVNFLLWAIVNFA